MKSKPQGEITCDVVRSFEEFLSSRGEHDFYDRVAAADPSDKTLSRDFLEGRRNRLTWNSFVTICDVLESYLPDEESQAHLFEHSARRGSEWMPWRAAVRLIASPKRFYLIYCKIITPTVWGTTLKAQIEPIDSAKLRLTLSIPKDVRGSKFFFAISGVGLIKMPRIIGYGDAIVEWTADEHSAEYIVTPPRSRTLWSLLVSLTRILTFPRVAFAEFTAQERQIRVEFERLRESEARLREVQTELETRVIERTQELERTNRELLHVQKLDALGTLAGGLSHEINNILQGVVLAVDQSERALQNGQSSAEGVRLAKKFARRGQDLMKQVLAFSRRVEFEKRAVGVTSTVRDALTFLRSTLPKTIEIVENFSADSERAAVMGDATYIHQMVVNLCANAAHSMRGRGGVLSVVVSMATPDRIAIEVSDNGVGIPEDIRDRVFEPFFTTKPVGEGSGMGLSVVHGIVRALGGDIRFSSEVGVGTTFRATFPSLVASSTEDVTHDSLLAEGGDERLLIVDDEPDLLSMLSDTLAVFGYKIRTASSGEEALEIFNLGETDVVLTDWNMPRMTGLELARTMKSRRPETPIILCTGFAESQIPESEHGIFASVAMKPLDGFALNESIRNALESTAH